MRLSLNGAQIEIPQGGRLLDVLAAAGVEDLRGIAVAVDGEVLPRSDWAGSTVREGQQVEVVRAVQGGGG